MQHLILISNPVIAIALKHVYNYDIVATGRSDNKRWVGFENHDELQDTLINIDTGSEMVDINTLAYHYPAFAAQYGNIGDVYRNTD